MRVIIAGGGTGGLATALALRKVGVDPLVLERAPAFTAIGAGLGLQVNAMKALTYIGGDAYWRQTSARIEIAEQRGLADDELISTSTYDAQVRKYGEHYYCGHRADLLTSLLTALPPECVRTGSRVVALEQTPDAVRVQLETGEQISGDLLVGADGLRSQVRTLLFGEQEGRFTGVVVWRGLIPREKVAERHFEKIITWLGPQRHVLLYPLRHPAHPDSVYSLSAFVPAGEVHRESWTASGDLADLHASLAAACPALQDLLDSMDSALITGIYFAIRLSAGRRTAFCCSATPRTRRHRAPGRERAWRSRTRSCWRPVSTGTGQAASGQLFVSTSTGGSHALSGCSSHRA